VSHSAQRQESELSRICVRRINFACFCVFVIYLFYLCWWCGICYFSLYFYLSFCPGHHGCDCMADGAVFVIFHYISIFLSIRAIMVVIVWLMVRYLLFFIIFLSFFLSGPSWLWLYGWWCGICYFSLYFYLSFCPGHRGCDCMVVGFITTYTISSYHHLRGWVWISLRRGVFNAILCDKVCQWLVAGQ
jgi:hypothetical protein